MKIEIEVDRNILKSGEPDISKYSFDEPVEDLTGLLDLFKRVALCLGYSVNGELEVTDDEF